ncbi:MAG: hypothetical protein WC022_03055 [Parcubacteria group bacterium]
MKQHIETKLGVIIILIIAITVGAFLWRWEKNGEENYVYQAPNQVIQKDNDLHNQDNKTNEVASSGKDEKIEISNQWTTVNHENFWHNTNLFANTNYSFPNIEFSYPENWEFKCCGDMDHASEHFISPSKIIDKSLPYVRIIDYVLSGCPNLESVCAMEKRTKITAKEEFNHLVSNVPVDQVLPRMKLEKLNTDTFVYKKIEADNRFSKAYIINLGDRVVEIDFVNYDLLNNAFIEKFLNSIVFEK